MGSSKKPTQQVADYYLSMHYGVCHGPVDEVKGVYIGEKAVWEGKASGNQTLEVNLPELLGGSKDGGGYVGNITVLNGDTTQVLPNWMASKMADPAMVPGFRGLLTLFFAGKGNVGGFNWGSNSPYIRDTWVKVFRKPKGFYPERATIPRNNGTDDLDANPVHMIWECVTNTVWGSGVDPALIDYVSMVAAADQLYAEGFGLSMIWTGQQSVDDFTAMILRHIDGAFDINPRSGLYTLNLIRGGYATEDLPVLDPSNFQLTNFTRRSWEETSNEVNVTWKNPLNEEEENVTYHDLGNIAQQGGNIVSETLDFTGIRTAALAMRVAQREGTRRSQPLAAIEGIASRLAWDWMPGDVVLLTWPKRNIYRLPMRIGTIDRGGPGSPGVSITAVEDEFYLPANPYAVPPSTGWVDTTSPPFPLTLVQPVSVPFFLLAQDVGLEDAAAVQYPATYIGVLAVSSDPSAFSFDLNVRGTDITGAPGYVSLGAKSITPYGKLPTALIKQETSMLPAFKVLYQAQLRAGLLMWIGTEGDDHELALITALDADTGAVTIRRACLDTVAKDWPEETPVWFYDAQLINEDDTQRTEGGTVTYRLLTRTARGTLPVDQAPDVTYTPRSRLALPYRPANVRIGGKLWPAAINGDLTQLQVTWSNRNRLLETDQVFPWSYGSISPEAGATVSVQLLNSDGSVLSTQEGLTGNSATIDLSGVTGGKAAIKVWAVRDGLRSYQVESHTFEIAGYGLNYGNYYGGF